MSDGDGPGDVVEVSEWSDIDNAPSVVTGAEKELVAQLFRDGIPNGYDAVVWIPDFKLDDDDVEIEVLEGSDNLAAGVIKSYSDKAWKFIQPHCYDATWGEFLPKSWTVVFEPTGRLEALEAPQRGLTDFAGGES